SEGRVVHDRDSLGIEDRVHIMVDIGDDTKIVQRRAEVTGAVRRRRWSDEEKGRIVAEAIAPGAVIADVASRTGVRAVSRAGRAHASGGGHAFGRRATWIEARWYGALRRKRQDRISYERGAPLRPARRCFDTS